MGACQGCKTKRGVIRAEVSEALPAVPVAVPRRRDARCVLPVAAWSDLCPWNSPALVISRTLKKVLWLDKEPTTVINRLEAAMGIDRAKSGR